MSNCLQCGAELPPRTEGKRERKFCDNKGACKQKYWAKNKADKTHVTIPIEKWNEIQSQMELAKLKLKGGGNMGHYVDINDLTKPTNKVEPQKPMGSDKSNFTINTTEPKENTMAFFNKYGCNTHEELKNKK